MNNPVYDKSIKCDAAKETVLYGGMFLLLNAEVS
jgi:hypothetical protein